MPDICMCYNRKDCPKQEQCYRAKAKPDRYQSYSDFENVCNKENNYKMFWKIENYKEVSF
jgi:hypothetical protein